MALNLKTLALGAIYAVFSAAGLLLLAFGEDAEQRAVGVAALLFFGGGGATVFLLRRRTARRREPLRLGTIRTRGGRAPAFIAAGDARVVTIAGAGLVSMGVGSLVLATYSDEPVMMLIIGGAFTAFGVFAVVRAARAASVALTREGLVMSTGTGRTFVAWSNIAGLAPFEMYDQPSLGIALHDPSAVGVGPILRGLMVVERQIVGSDLTLGLNAYRTAPEHLAGAIVRYLESPELRPRIGRQDELDALTALLPAPEAALPPEDTRRRAVAQLPLRLTLAGLILIAFGLLLSIGALALLFGDAPADRQASRVIGGVIAALLAAAHAVGAILVLKRHPAGSPISLATSVALAVLGLLLLGGTAREDGGVGVVIGAAALTGSAFVVWAVLTGRRHPATRAPSAAAAPPGEIPR